MPFLAVLEYMPGGDLQTWLRDASRHEGLRIVTMVNTGAQLADALCYLHAVGVLHRDLAARNVLVGDSLELVKLADFGMSREVNEKNYYRQTTRVKKK